MEDFNVDLLKYTTRSDVFIVLTSLNKITYSYKHGIKNSRENIFSSNNAEEPISGNIFTSVFNHSAQFVLFPIENTKGNMKKKIVRRDFKYLIGNKVVETLQSTDPGKPLRLN